MSPRASSTGDLWLRIGAGAVLILLAAAVAYSVAIALINMPRIGV
jgi:hypothetical protein